MNALFVGGPDLATRSRDGRNFVLIEAKCIRTETALYRMPAGSVSDGASTPEPLWSLGLAPFGVYWPAAFAHDCAYRGTLQVQSGMEWIPANLTKAESDDLLSALMFSLGVVDKDRITIYEGVHLAGWKAFREDRQVQSAVS